MRNRSNHYSVKIRMDACLLPKTIANLKRSVEFVEINYGSYRKIKPTIVDVMNSGGSLSLREVSAIITACWWAKDSDKEKSDDFSEKSNVYRYVSDSVSEKSRDVWEKFYFDVTHDHLVDEIDITTKQLKVSRMAAVSAVASAVAAVSLTILEILRSSSVP